jgi:hypothetical protein
MRWLIPFLLIAFAGIPAIAHEHSKPGKDKVAICHVTASGNQLTLWVSANSVDWEGHKNHDGDYLGECKPPEPPPPPPPPPCPDGQVRNENGVCVPVTPPPPTPCPEGQVRNEAGVCVPVIPPPPPPCPDGQVRNIVGICVPVTPPPPTPCPEGQVRNEAGICVPVAPPPPPPPCPQGQYRDGSGMCVNEEPPPPMYENIVDFFIDPDLVSGFVGERVAFTVSWVDRNGTTHTSGPQVMTEIIGSSSRNAQMSCVMTRCQISGDSAGTVVGEVRWKDIRRTITLVVVPAPPKSLTGILIGMPDKLQADNGQVQTLHYWSLSEYGSGSSLRFFYGQKLPMISSETLLSPMRQGEMRTMRIVPVMPNTQPACIPSFLEIKTLQGAGEVMASGGFDHCVKIYDRRPPVDGSSIVLDGSGHQIVRLRPNKDIELQDWGTIEASYVVLTYGSKFAIPLKASFERGCDGLEVHIGPRVEQGFNIGLPARQYNVAVILEYQNGKVAVFGAPHALSVPASVGSVNLK